MKKKRTDIQSKPPRQNRRGWLRYCAGGFAVSAVLVVALCGFALVDLSTERYMPGQFPPLFQLGAVDREGARFTFLGTGYRIKGEAAAQALELAHRYRGLLPAGMRWASQAAAEAYAAVEALPEGEEDLGGFTPEP